MSLPTLFEIDRQLEETIEALEMAQELGHESMVDAFTETLKELMLKHTQKVDSCIGYIRKTEGYVEAVDGEIKRLQSLKKRLEGRIEYVKTVAENVMMKNGLIEMPGTMERKFWVKESKFVKLLDEKMIPEQFKRITTVSEIDKRAILEALKDNVYVPGTELGTRLNIQVK